jgi:hypothetical protein
VRRRRVSIFGASWKLEGVVFSHFNLKQRFENALVTAVEITAIVVGNEARLTSTVTGTKFMYAYVE